jgi:Methylase involved in ubiquinone/menaquinone biosynthesis
MSLLVPPRRPSHEVLDETDLPPYEMARSLEDLDLVNRALGSARLLEERMANPIRSAGGSRATILDVGAGSASVARELELRLERQGLTARVIATDLQWRHLAVGRTRGGREFPAAAADVFSLPFPERSVDWVVSTLLVHHFSPEENVRLLRELARVARRGVLLLDLQRHRLPLLFISLAGRMAFKSRVSVEDGAASVRQAYTREEAQAFASRAIPGARVERVFPFRLLISHP